MSCRILTDFPDRFARTTDVLVGDPPRAYQVENRRIQGGTAVLKLAGVNDRDSADGLRGELIQVPIEQAVELPAGTYFWHQIIGLQVIDSDGRELGRVTEILPTGSNDVYVVSHPRGELLIPAISDVIREIDLKRGTIVISLLPGLEA